MKTELSEKSQLAICNSAIEAKKDIEWKFITVGGLLHKIKNERLWKAGWGSWAEYQMDFGMTQTDISKLMNIYDIFILHYEFKPLEIVEAGGWRKVGELLPLVRLKTAPRGEVEGDLGISLAQPREDLRLTVADIKRGAVCEHEHTRRLVLDICEDCNERWTVPEG